MSKALSDTSIPITSTLGVITFEAVSFSNAMEFFISSLCSLSISPLASSTKTFKSSLVILLSLRFTFFSKNLVQAENNLVTGVKIKMNRFKMPATLIA